MTHPEMLQIPRAVVEQALEALEATHFGSGAQNSEARIALRAALQPQAADTYGLPVRDLSKPAEQQGVFRKFNVQRTDGSDKPGGKHHGCEYFVLDVAHDQHAKPALEAYAVACATTHPQLSADMRARYGLQPQAAAEPVNEWREAVLDAVAAYSMDFRMDVPPCVIVNQLLGMAVTMAKDPAINKEAATYYTEAEGDAYAHGFFDGLREPFPTTPPATQAENPLLKDYVEKAVAAERRKWQAALTAALEKFNEIVSMEGTESNEWDGVERVIPEMCAVAKAAIAQIEALASGNAGVER